MLNPLSWLKHRLSHVRESSWHFQLVKEIWKAGAYDSKACSYYWFKIPSSLLLLCLGILIMGLIIIVAGFLGFVPTVFETKSPLMRSRKDGVFYPYKTLPSSKRLPIAPWEIAAMIVVLYGIYDLAVIDQQLGFWVMSVGMSLTALAMVVYLIYKIWRLSFFVNLRSKAGFSASQTWDGVCPKLVVDDK